MPPSFVDSGAHVLRSLPSQFVDEAEDGSGSELLAARLSAMGVVFSVSLLAASFPTASKRISFLRIPKIVFFVGKHFGTGVILSTAFVHLLQDAFEALLDPRIRKDHPRIGQWAGLIVLASLLSIFMVEYVSTSYVDRISPESQDHAHGHGHHHTHSHSTSHHTQAPSDASVTTERAPLLPAARPRSYSHGDAPSPSSSDSESSNSYFHHHRHESRASHSHHHGRTPRNSFIGIPNASPETKYGPEDFGQGHIIGTGHVHRHGEGTGGHAHAHAHIDGQEPDEEHGSLDEEECAPDDDAHGDASGRKRQIVSILVLQMGIMLHSFVIGITLSITAGPEFASLLIAVGFHQLFEGLSLGIRIAALPTTGRRWLSALLVVLFASAVPMGIALGLLAFSARRDMQLAQGVMSAASAGMLVYAACVEMLAGDFVMDPLLWRAGVWRQALALGSMLCGAVAMTALGIWD